MPQPPGPGLAPSLAPSMVTAVGGCLAGLGILGATFATWQLLAWALWRGAPVLSDVWSHYGLTGGLFAVLFDWLPVWLLLAIAFHAFVARLGFGLFRRERWARRGAIGFAWAWAALAALGWAAVWYALDDLQRGYPDRAQFAGVAKLVLMQVSLLNLGLSAALVLLMIQPSVRARFGG